MVVCRHCGAVNQHWTHTCPLGPARASNPNPAPLIEDAAWTTTVRDLSDPVYIAWLAEAHELVLSVIKQLKSRSEMRNGDIELEGAEKALMHAGWRHGPYVHDPNVPKASWKKYVLRVQTHGDGRVLFKRSKMAIHFEDTEGTMRMLNANNFFTKATPEENQLKKVRNAVRDSPEWKQKSSSCTLTLDGLARRVLEVFPEVEYRREGHVEIFVDSARGKHARDNDVYTFIRDELQSSVHSHNSAHSNEASGSSTAVGETSRARAVSTQVSLLGPLHSPEFAVSEVESLHAVVLHIGRMPQQASNALLSSDLAAAVRAEGLEVEPEWANGAKVFVPIAAEDIPADVTLRPWHVLVREEDRPRIDEILRTLRCRERPRIKSSRSLSLSQRDDEEAALVFDVQHTFIHVAEEPWIAPRSDVAHSCDGASPPKGNPRAHWRPTSVLFARLKDCHSRCDLAGATQCYSSILRDCGAPSIHIFTIMIDICGKTGAHDDAERWVHVMQDDHGILPTHVTFNCLINGYAKAGETAKAEKWYTAMLQAGIKPEVQTFKCMIRAFSLQGRVEQAMSWFNMAQSQCEMMDASIYMIVMRMCAREGLDDEIEACHDKLKCAGLDGARGVFTAVISGYADARELEKAKIWNSRAIEAGFCPKLSEYTQLLRACGPKESQPANPDQAREIFLRQVAEGIAPDRANLEALTDALGQRAYYRLTQELHVHMSAARLPWWPDPQDISKPMRLARGILGLSFSSDAAPGEP